MNSTTLSSERDLTATPEPAQVAEQAPAQVQTAYVSISEAARLTGKSRTTIYAHEAKGFYTFSKNHEGGSVVQVSDLLRQYGAFVAPEPEQTPAQLNTSAQLEQHRAAPSTEHDLTSPASTVQATEQPAASAVSKPSGQGAGALIDALRRLESVQRQLTNERSLREAERASAEARIADLKDFAESWQEQAKSSQRLLEHEQTRDKPQQKPQRTGLLAWLFGG